MRSTDTLDTLAPQDGLYTLAEQGGDGERLEILGALRMVHGPAQRPALLDSLTRPETRIVSLTITEKEYLRTAEGDARP